jgi:hypothetical protein
MQRKQNIIISTLSFRSVHKIINISKMSIFIMIKFICHFHVNSLLNHKKSLKIIELKRLSREICGNKPLRHRFISVFLLIY